MRSKVANVFKSLEYTIQLLELRIPDKMMSSFVLPWEVRGNFCKGTITIRRSGSGPVTWRSEIIIRSTKRGRSQKLSRTDAVQLTETPIHLSAVGRIFDTMETSFIAARIIDTGVQANIANAQHELSVPPFPIKHLIHNCLDSFSSYDFDNLLTQPQSFHSLGLRVDLHPTSNW